MMTDDHFVNFFQLNKLYFKLSCLSYCVTHFYIFFTIARLAMKIEFV